MLVFFADKKDIFRIIVPVEINYFKVPNEYNVLNVANTVISQMYVTVIRIGCDVIDVAEIHMTKITVMPKLM
jgi:hypothetical protein